MLPSLLRYRNPSTIRVLVRLQTQPAAIPRPDRRSHFPPCAQYVRYYSPARQEPRVGTTTPVPANYTPDNGNHPTSPFYFEAGYALYAKRPSRPFPPPFLSYPSGSFSEPLSTHNRSRDRRPTVNGEMIRGVTNGDDAVLVSDYFIGANDGVGAWGTKEKGHAAYVFLKC